MKQKCPPRSILVQLLQVHLFIFYHKTAFASQEIKQPNTVSDAVLLQEQQINSQHSPDAYGDNNNGNSIKIEATLDSNGATLAVNGVEVYTCVNETFLHEEQLLRFHAGIHLITLHEVTGHVMRTNHFMTWQEVCDEQLLETLNHTQDGRLLVLMGTPEFNSHLGPEALSALAKLGSWFVSSLANNENWCLVVYKGDHVVLESVTTDAAIKKFKRLEVPPLRLQFTVSPMKARQCEWHRNQDWKKRAIFCETYEGYGDFCTCDQQPTYPWSTPLLDYAIREEIPVVIVTAKRFPNVLQQVTKLRNNPGGFSISIVIIVDGQNSEIRDLGRLLNVTVVENYETTLEKGSAGRISQHINFALREVFRLHPKAEKAIILEDDLDVSPDFIPYFHQTAPLLDSDQTLLCVNAYNYNAFNHTAYDPSRLYRIQGTPAFGWMTNRRAAQIMLDNWAPVGQPSDWDYWLAHHLTNSSIIIPEVPRTRHLGGGGSHVSGLEQSLYFNMRLLNHAVNVTLDIESVEREEYMASTLAAVREAEVIRFKEHPCKTVYNLRYDARKSFVVYVYMPNGTQESRALYVASRCLGLNDRGLYEHFMMTVSVKFFGSQLYVVGCPNSPFCLTDDDDDVYHATPFDVHYAKTHPFREASSSALHSRRISASSFREFVLLTNLDRVMKVTQWI